MYSISKIYKHRIFLNLAGSSDHHYEISQKISQDSQPIEEFSCYEYRDVLPWILISLDYLEFSLGDSSPVRHFAVNEVGIVEPALKIQFDNLIHRYSSSMSYLKNNQS